MVRLNRLFAPRRAPADRPRLRPSLETLEARVVPAHGHGLALGHSFNKVIVAGDPNGTPTDSPSARVDANTTTSPFAGVGSVRTVTRGGTYIGSATAISPRHILTAGHVVDINSDGKLTSRDKVTSISFILNFGGNQSHVINVSTVSIHPDFTGFARPSVNDDIAVLTLAAPLPAGVPIYSLPASDLTGGTTLTLVGYGRSGNGVSGYTTNASFTTKRKGENNADAFSIQDDSARPAANEVFRFDFDGPTGSGSLGGPTLGNDRETTLGGGDSGGPSFVPNGSGGYVLVGVNTFTEGLNAPRFGSRAGGMNVFTYVGFINSILNGASSMTSGSGAATGAAGVANAISALLDPGTPPLIVRPAGPFAEPPLTATPAGPVVPDVRLPIPVEAPARGYVAPPAGTLVDHDRRDPREFVASARVIRIQPRPVTPPEYLPTESEVTPAPEAPPAVLPRLDDLLPLPEPMEDETQADVGDELDAFLTPATSAGEIAALAAVFVGLGRPRDEERRRYGLRR